MRHHPYRNYRIISVLFWSFPYLLWQAFGHWSGFIVGVIMAVILTVMLNNLFRTSGWNKAHFTERQSSRTEKPYQRGYRAEVDYYRDRAESRQYQEEAHRTQYEEMQVPYPEMPPPS